jgi:hypothetical protein
MNCESLVDVEADLTDRMSRPEALVRVVRISISAYIRRRSWCQADRGHGLNHQGYAAAVPHPPCSPQDCQMPEPDPTLLPTAIAELSDLEAIRSLALVANYQGLGSDPADQAQVEDHLREALSDPKLAAYTPHTTTYLNDGELARRTLSCLIEQGPAPAQLVDQAIDLAKGPGERFDLPTLAIGGLILAALQTEVELERSPEGNWRFRLHKQPMRESTLGQLLTALIARFTPHD